MRFIELLSSSQFSCALSLLRSSPQPASLAEECDASGDTALSWAVYKSRLDPVPAFQVICQLLLLRPSQVKQRATNTFLPLHDAAWGGAPSAIATLLTAAFPGALHDRAQRQSPHEVFWYHHTKHPRGWVPADNMLQAALGIRSNGDWLQTLSALHLNSMSELRLMSAAEIQSCLNISQALADLVVELFRAPSTPLHGAGMPSIPEDRPRYQNTRRSGLQSPTRRQRPSRGRVIPGSCAKLPSDETEYLREPSIKTGMYAVKRKQRTFRELFSIMDGSGTIHYLSQHEMRRMPKKVRSQKEQKFPSKTKLCRERAFDRDEKASKCGQFR